MTETSNPNPDKNQHITEYLEYYINQEEPADSAILLTGSWGCGKTYYIDQFIDKIKSEDGQQKYIFKISLFGLKTTADLDDQIGQEICYSLEVGLGQGARVLGKALTAAGTVWNFLDTPIKIKQDKLQEASENLSKKLEKFLFDKNKNNITFVFDDLERTEIPLKELLGHINAFVERDHIKIILIANEDELTKEFIQQEQAEEEEKEASKTKAYISEDDLKNRETYKKFREKVIGKTFEVQSDLDNTLTYFIQNNSYNEILLTHYSILKEIYSSQKNINLRQLKQALNDFAYLLKNLKKEHKQYPDFLRVLIYAFFGLTLALHNKEFSTESLKMLIDLQQDEKTDSQFFLAQFLHPNDQYPKAQKKQKLEKEFQKIYQNYNIQTPVYSQDVWYDILVTNNLYNIKVITDKLIYFVHEKRPLWLQCYDFLSLDQDSFITLSQELIKFFENLEDEDYYEYLHLIGLLIEWSNQNLISKTIDKITVTAQQFLEKYAPNWANKYSEGWKNFQNYTSGFDHNNWTNHGFYSSNDPHFQKIEKLFQQKQQEAVQTIQQAKKEEQQEKVLNDMKDNDYLKLRDFLIYSHNTSWEPIFHKIGQEKFIKILLELNNNQLVNLNRIFQARYLHNNTLNNKTIPFYMVPEFFFWIDVKAKIKAYLAQQQQSLQTIQNCNLEQLLKTIQKIIHTIQPFFIINNLKQKKYPEIEQYLCGPTAQLIIFNENILTDFEQLFRFYGETTINMDELGPILLKRYEYLNNIPSLKTELLFWEKILNISQNHPAMEDFASTFEKIIQKIKEKLF